MHQKLTILFATVKVKIIPHTSPFNQELELDVSQYLLPNG